MAATADEEQLVLAFLGACLTPVLPPPGLGQQLSRGLQAGRDKYPSVPLGDEEFARYIAQHCPPGPLLDDTLDALNLEELFLAAGVANKDPLAQAVFDRCFLSNVEKFLSSFNQDVGLVAEVTQRMRLKLYGGESPGIRQYAGIRPLHSWLAVMAKRAAIDVLRAGSGALGSMSEPEDASHLLPTGADQELELLRHRHADDYGCALKECMAALTPEQRNLLRLYYAQGLTLEKIGALKGVKASTILRRMRTICDGVLICVRDKLIHEGGVSESSFDSIERLVRSQLDVNISSILSAPISK
jgi:RNA polymerase sigma-70 factor (ECF subfamily)